MNRTFLTILINSLILAILLIGVFYFIFVRFVKSIPDAATPPELTGIHRKAIFFQEYAKYDHWAEIAVNSAISSTGISFETVINYKDQNFFAIRSNELGRSTLFTKNIQLLPSTLPTSSPSLSVNLSTTTALTSTTSQATSTITTTTTTVTVTTTTATSTKINTTTMTTSSKSNASKK